jgi:hypothetical protein
MTDFEQQMLNLTQEILENTKKNACPEIQKIQIMEELVAATRDLKALMSMHGQPFFVKQTLMRMYTALDQLPKPKEPKVELHVHQHNQKPAKVA